MDQDIRWKQKFSNYKKALSQLKKFINTVDLNEFEKQGLIHIFECAYEQAANTVQSYAKTFTETPVYGFRDSLEAANKAGLTITLAEWHRLIDFIPEIQFAYEEAVAEKVVKAIREKYFCLFTQLEIVLSRL